MSSKPRADLPIDRSAESTALHDWASSGAMAITGRGDGPPLVAPTRAATVVRECLDGLGLSIPGLLGERAAIAGLRRNGPWSCGGATRVLRTLDGRVVLTLARAPDVELVPALVCGAASDPWSAVAAWAASSTTDDASARIRLLGLPGGAVTTSGAERAGVVVTALGRRAPSARPLVVDLSSLWAGPLCAHLLGLTGAQVITVESRQRPDGARRGPAHFFELLHRGHEHRWWNIDDPSDTRRLLELLHTADLVVESSRPRALRGLGIDAEEVVAAGTSWVSITARGRSSEAVGFGDDVAACAGLVVPHGEDILLVGDALADPLTGAVAAVAAHGALDRPESVLLDVSMLDVAAATRATVPDHAVTRADDGGWWVEDHRGRSAVAMPRARP